MYCVLFVSDFATSIVLLGYEVSWLAVVPNGGLNYKAGAACYKLSQPLPITELRRSAKIGLEHNMIKLRLSAFCLLLVTNLVFCTCVIQAIVPK